MNLIYWMNLILALYGKRIDKLYQGGSKPRALQTWSDDSKPTNTAGEKKCNKAILVGIISYGRMSLP